jgi:hypothetical protein
MICITPPGPADAEGLILFTFPSPKGREEYQKKKAVSLLRQPIVQVQRKHFYFLISTFCVLVDSFPFTVMK